MTAAPILFARLAPLAFIFLWSMVFVAVRAGLPDVSPLYFLAVRFAIATVILVTIAALWRLGWTGLRQTWRHFVVAGVLINALYLSAAYLAMTEISGATLALLGALHPLLTALLSGPVLGERFRARQWLGVACGIAGVALVVGIDANDLAQRAGVAWGLSSVVCLTAGTLYYSRYCRGLGLVQANTIQLAAAAAVTAAFALAFEDVRADWTPTALATVGFLVCAVSLGGMALLLYMLKNGAAGRVAANFYLTPGTTAVLGWLILGETLSPLAILGFVIASVGVWLVNRGG
ncbi:MAG: DMT family transporter [Proteobacteria bacterium]|nr:DMT family transporter [Pseudomonadota bacterium]